MDTYVNTIYLQINDIHIVRLNNELTATLVTFLEWNYFIVSCHIILLLISLYYSTATIAK